MLPVIALLTLFPVLTRTNGASHTVFVSLLAKFLVPILAPIGVAIRLKPLPLVRLLSAASV